MKLSARVWRWTAAIQMAALLVWTAFLPGAVLRVQAQAQDLTVGFLLPHQGETFYAGPTSLLYNIPVSGWVKSSRYPAGQIALRLDVLQDGGVITGTQLIPDGDGAFAIRTMVNPHGSVEYFPAENRACGDKCHNQVDLALPNGRITLRITARDPSGTTASAQRDIRVDLSQVAWVPVKVVLASDGATPAAQVAVKGSTWLYQWRARHATAASDERGDALLKVEALTQSSTRYRIAVEPVVVGGVQYESDPVDITLPAGATSAPLVTLKVRTRLGSIVGNLSGRADKKLDAGPVWAIHLPEGSPYQAQPADNGVFRFQGLPLGRYLLSMDKSALQSQGYAAQDQVVDLSTVTEAALDFPLAGQAGSALKGAVRSADGAALPFAWVSSQKLGWVRAVEPESGRVELAGLSAGTNVLIAAAPGYYSQAAALQAGPGNAAEFAFSLAPLPETQLIPWGQGRLVLPPDSVAQLGDGQVALERGWLWGQGGAGRPLTVKLAGYEIDIAQGQFALEQLPGQPAWFYLLAGEASIRPLSQAQPVILRAHQMVALNPVALSPAASPVPLDWSPVVFAALHPAQSALPTDLHWQTTLSARLRDGLARLGVNTAKIITFITYLWLYLSIGIVPAFGVYWLLRHLRARRAAAAHVAHDNGKETS